MLKKINSVTGCAQVTLIILLFSLFTQPSEASYCQKLLENSNMSNPLNVNSSYKAAFVGLGAVAGLVLVHKYAQQKYEKLSRENPIKSEFYSNDFIAVTSTLLPIFFVGKTLANQYDIKYPKSLIFLTYCTGAICLNLSFRAKILPSKKDKLLKNYKISFQKDSVNKYSYQGSIELLEDQKMLQNYQYKKVGIIKFDFDKINQIAYVVELNIDKNYQKLGLGSILLENTKNWLELEGCKHIYGYALPLTSNMSKNGSYTAQYTKYYYTNRANLDKFYRQLGARPTLVGSLLYPVSLITPVPVSMEFKI